ncbi:MAG: DUF2236 domain-containing protein [Actinomycetota bacterium]|nr:DUF2236 domain-containing protein [Actinomycetota bacterium]
MRSDHGYFPTGSILRKIHRERMVGLMYGQRALAIGAIDPRNFVGTRIHTSSPSRPFHRLVVTAKMFEAIFFGSKLEADRVLAAVHGMHSKVRGVLPETAGPMPAGTPYSALDAEQMLWTIAPAADSAVYFYELFVRELTATERDSFWADYVRFGELFGMDPAVTPGTWLDFRKFFDAKVNGPDAHLTDEARYTGSAVMFQIPTTRPRWPAMSVHNLLIRGSLPPRVRELYGLGWSRVDALRMTAAVRAARASRPLTPRSALRGSCVGHFDDVAEAERRIIDSGKTVPGSLPPAQLPEPSARAA